MTEEIKALKSLISTWEKRAKRAERMLVHLRAVLAGMTEEDAAVIATPARRKPAAPPAGVPFSSKYEKRSEDYILEALSARALSLRQLQETLAADGKVYSDQAVTHALKKLIKAGRVRQQPAPPGSAARSVFELNRQPALDFPQRRVG